MVRAGLGESVLDNSVFVYESNVSLWGNGDWLQLAAASSWMLSNIASAINSN